MEIGFEGGLKGVLGGFVAGGGIGMEDSGEG